MRLGRNRRDGGNPYAGIRRAVFVATLAAAVFLGVLPAWATITGPGSTHVVPGSAVGVGLTTDGTIIFWSQGDYAGISISRSGSAPTFRFTFSVATSVTPGSYGYAFIDDAGDTKPFTLIVDDPSTTTTTLPPTTTTTTTTTTTLPPTTTTTTTTLPPTTTTTRPPPRTTTTEPATTTTISTPPIISIGDGSTTEGKIVWFKVTLSAAFREVVTVDYVTADGTATTADSDYAETSGKLTFDPGDKSETIAVATGGDTRDEPNEDFTITLSAPTNATIRDGSATGTIVDDDLTSAAATSNDTSSSSSSSSSTTTVVAVAAQEDRDERGRFLPVVFLSGGLALLTLALGARYGLSRTRRAGPKPLTGSTGIGDWWRTSGPVISFRERRQGRIAAKDLRNKIDERRRIQDE